MKTTLKTLFLLLLAGLVSCNGNSDKHNEAEHDHESHGPENTVVLNAAQREALNLELGDFLMRNLTTVVKLNGQLEVPPASRADVSVAIGGNVKSIRVFLGDKVKKGQLLAVLEHPDYITLQEDFAVVASELEFLEKNYQRQKELYENKVGSGRDYQQAKAEYNTAKARYEGLKSRLKLLNLSPARVQSGEISGTVNLYSPINGYVNKINVKIGSYADATDQLFEITDNSAIHADFLVYEKDVYLLEEGQKIHFTVSSLPGVELLATVFAIGKEFEPATRAVHIHARITDPAPGLIPGMYISGHLHADEHYVKTLPNDAIVREGTKAYIFVVDGDGMADEHDHEGDGHDHGEEDHAHDAENGDLMAFRMVEVMTGRQDDGYTEVKLLDDLPEGTQIVMNAAYYLLADMKKEETEHKH